MFNYMSMYGTYEQRVVANTEVDGGVIDTCYVTDASKDYETGISHPKYNNGDWIIVEAYDTKEQAEAGHEKWVKYLSTQPVELKDNGVSSIGSLGKLVGCGIVFKRED